MGPFLGDARDIAGPAFPGSHTGAIECSHHNELDERGHEITDRHLQRARSTASTRLGIPLASA
jgi:hypothetical protein